MGQDRNCHRKHVCRSLLLHCTVFKRYPSTYYL